MENKEGQVVVRPRLIAEKDRSFFGRFCLPLILMLSFAWLNLYSYLTEVNDVFYSYKEYESLTSFLIVSVLTLVIIDYIVFELEFYVYRLFIGFSIYSYMIPKYVLLDKFRTWYIYRNIVLGLIFNLRFFFPYISAYLCIIEVVLNFAFIIGLYFDLKNKYIEPLVGQYVFKTLVLPVVLYEAYIIITLMVGVLW